MGPLQLQAYAKELHELQRGFLNTSMCYSDIQKHEKRETILRV